MNSTDSTPPFTSPPQQTSLSRARRTFKRLVIAIVLLLGGFLATMLYVMIAPPIEGPQVPPKLQFHGRSALRKRPSMESAPIAYSKPGTTLEILSSADDWVQVRIEGKISGWTPRDEGTIIPPPPPQLTPRQRAKQQLQHLFARLSGFFKSLTP